MERITIFMDFANIAAGSIGYSTLDYGKLLAYLGEGRFVVDAYAYVPVDPRNPSGRDFIIEHLQETGWMVMSKTGKVAGDGYKCNVDVEMTIDIMRHAYQVRPDILILCSGDGDFVPIVRELRLMGIRVEAAAFQGSAARELRREASGFVLLDQWLREVGRDELVSDEDDTDQIDRSSPAPRPTGQVPSASDYR